MTIQEARAALAGLAPPGERIGEVRLEFDGPVAHLRVDNPGARSAMSVSMMVELADAILALSVWAGALVVVTSTDPRSFCSGGHLGQVTRAVNSPDGARTMARAMSAVLDGLLDLPIVSVAAIDGVALGGGAELATATDFRVASPEARIHFAHARLGIAPGWGGAGRLVRFVGRRAALRILTSARPLAPGEAAELGLVDHRCDGPAVEGALAWLDDLPTLAPEAVRAVKRQVVAAGPARGAGAEAEVEAFAEVWGGPAHVRALASLERHRR